MHRKRQKHLESLDKGRLSLGIPQGDACYHRDARMQGFNINNFAPTTEPKDFEKDIEEMLG